MSYNEWVVSVMRGRQRTAALCHPRGRWQQSPENWAHWSKMMHACKVWKRTAVARMMAQ